ETIARDLLTRRSRVARHLALARYFTRPSEISDGEGNAVPNRRVVSELPFHLAGSKQFKKLHATLFDRSFLASKLQADGPVSALEDFELAPAKRMPDPAALSQLAAAIRLSIAPLSTNPEEITSQLPGRLPASGNVNIAGLVASLGDANTRPA